MYTERICEIVLCMYDYAYAMVLRWVGGFLSCYAFLSGPKICEATTNKTWDKTHDQIEMGAA